MKSDTPRNPSGVSASLLNLLPQGLNRIIRKKRLYRERRGRFMDHLMSTDSFLVGHPKSGNTWTAYMLAIVSHRDDNRIINLSNIGDYVPVIHNRDFIIDHYSSLVSPRIFRNESPLFPELYPRTIYLVRDPRAALLSYYHHCVHDTGNHDWPVTDFVDEMLEFGCIKRLEPMLDHWDKQVREWLVRAETQRVEIVRFEDIKQDQHSALTRMIEFLEIPSSQALIDHAIRRSSFSSMRSEEEVFGSESFLGEKGSRGYFVRKGEVDSWKSEMPAESIRKIEDAYGDTMTKVGYTV